MFSYCKTNYDMCLYRLGPDNLNQYDDIHPSTSLLAFSGTEWIFSSMACLWVFATSDLALFCQSTTVAATSSRFLHKAFFNADCFRCCMWRTMSFVSVLLTAAAFLSVLTTGASLISKVTTFRHNHPSNGQNKFLQTSCPVSFGRCNNAGTRYPWNAVSPEPTWWLCWIIDNLRCTNYILY